jgi:replicative DNA helicase
MGESERATVVSLQKLFMELKKYGKNTIIQVSQMNREIEDKERINNPILHYPVRRDLSASDSMFQASDYVIVLHRPELLNIKAYGRYNKPVKNRIYMHFLKVREGHPKILVFENQLKYNRIIEIDDIKEPNT